MTAHQRPNVALYVDVNVKDLVRRRCKLEGLSLNEVIRRFMKDYANNGEAPSSGRPNGSLSPKGLSQAQPKQVVATPVPSEVAPVVAGVQAQGAAERIRAKMALREGALDEAAKRLRG